MARFDAFVTRHNQERPHQPLAMKVPADLYARSPRVYRGLDEPSYLFHDATFTVRLEPIAPFGPKVLLMCSE